MLEIQRIRNEKEAVIAGLKKRNFDATEVVDSLLGIDLRWRNSKTELESISAELNILAKEIGELFKQGKQAEATAAKAKTADLKEKEAVLKTTVEGLALRVQVGTRSAGDCPCNAIRCGALDALLPIVSHAE